MTVCHSPEAYLRPSGWTGPSQFSLHAEVIAVGRVKTPDSSLGAQAPGTASNLLHVAAQIRFLPGELEHGVH